MLSQIKLCLWTQFKVQYTLRVLSVLDVAGLLWLYKRWPA